MHASSGVVAQFTVRQARGDCLGSIGANPKMAELRRGLAEENE